MLGCISYVHTKADVAQLVEQLHGKDIAHRGGNTTANLELRLKAIRMVQTVPLRAGERLTRGANPFIRHA